MVLNLKFVMITQLLLITCLPLALYYRLADRRMGYCMIIGAAIINIGTAHAFWVERGGFSLTAVEVTVVGFLVVTLISLYSAILATPVPTKTRVFSKPIGGLIFILYGGAFFAALFVFSRYDVIRLNYMTGFYLAFPWLGAGLAGIGELVKRRQRRIG